MGDLKPESVLILKAGLTGLAAMLLRNSFATQYRAVP
jgi:Tfp pilus assembly protein PilV